MPATFLYVGNAETNDISVFRLDRRDGGLTAVATVPVPDVGVAQSCPMAVSPDKRFLFVGNRAAPYTVATFGIDPKTGALAHLSKGPLPHQMCYIVTDKTGRWLLSASYQGNQVAVNPIGADGQVGAIQQTIAVPPAAHSILPDPANRYAFVPSLGGDVVNLFRFDEKTGALAPNEPATIAVREKDGPRHFRFHPNGKTIYLLNETDVSLCVFDYDAGNGRWTEKQIVSFRKPGFTGHLWASDLQITRDGRFLYAAERGASTIAAFRIDPQTGLLSPIGHFDTETQPRGFAIDHSGKYLYGVGQLSHHMTGYAIKSGGALRVLKRYAVGKNPNWVEIVDLPSAS